MTDDIQTEPYCDECKGNHYIIKNNKEYNCKNCCVEVPTETEMVVIFREEGLIWEWQF